MGDLGCSVRRIADVDLVGLANKDRSEKGVIVAGLIALVARKKLVGLRMSLQAAPELLLERLAKRAGSTFSKSSLCRSSDFRLLLETGELAA